MTIAAGGSFGNRSCIVQPKKVSASILFLNNPTVSRHLSINAPMTLTWPLRVNHTHHDITRQWAHTRVFVAYREQTHLRQYRR